MSKQLKFAEPGTFPLSPSSLVADLAARLRLGPLEELASLQGRQIVFSLRNGEARPISSWHADLALPVSRFNPQARDSMVVGIDSSCISIAEADDGSIYAAKVCAVFCRAGGTEGHLRLGPLLFYLRESNVLDMFGSRPEAKRLASLVLLDSSLAQRLIRRRIEQALALEFTRMLDDAVILLDGSLKRSVLDAQDGALKQVVEEAEAHGSVVMGISKSTHLKMLCRLMGLLDQEPSAPVYVDVHHLAAQLTSGLLGRVLLVRFTEGGHAFRVDLGSRDASYCEDALARVRWNDVFHEGYPESLRLAHHLSLFSSADDASIKCLVAGRLGAVEVVGENVRRTILGTLRVRVPQRRGSACGL